MANGTLKVSNIETSSGSGTITIGQSGETVTIPSGVTIANSGTATGFGNTNAPIFYAYGSSGISLTNNAFTKITFDTEVVDASGIYDTSNNRVTFGSTGRFVLAVRLNVSNTGTNAYTVRVYRNGSGWRDVYTDYFSNSTDLNVNAYCLINNENTTDYYEVYVYQNSGSGKTTGSGMHALFFAGYKIIE